MADSRVPALFVLAGLVGSVTGAALTPAPEVASLQLRALNHRCLHANPATTAGLAEALIHPLFRATHHDGRWLSRADFMAELLQRPAPDDARLDDERVQLFGPVALVQGLYTAGAAARRYTDVYLWDQRGWQLVSAQDTALRPGAARSRVTGTAPALPPWAGQDPEGEDLDVLTALNEHYVRAFRECDLAWYDTHLAPGFTVVSGDGSCQDRSAALQDFARPVFADTLASFPVSQVQVRRFADIALIHAANRYELKDGRRGESRYTDIWRHQDGRWRCVAAHITPYCLPTTARA